MSLYAAIDLHSNNGVLSVIDDQDRLVFERRLPNELPQVMQALMPYRDELHALAVESTYNWYWLVDGLMAEGIDVRLVNTAAVPQYAGLKHGNDQTDARHLAHLLRLGILPEGYIYPRDQRSVRDLLRRRFLLVRQRVSVMNSLQAAWSRRTGHGLRGVALSAEVIEAALSRTRPEPATSRQGNQWDIASPGVGRGFIASLDPGGAMVTPFFERLRP